MIPTKEQNPKGLHKKYVISKVNGDKIDDDAEYFVLRLDEGGNDTIHTQACRKAIITYAEHIKNHLPELSKDLIERYQSKNTDFEKYKLASEIVEKVLNDNDKNELYNLSEILWKPYYDIEQRRDKRFFYVHLSTLFLNVLLNRLDEWGKRGEEVSMESRRIIIEILKKVDE